jgi:hypothetical protein
MSGRIVRCPGLTIGWLAGRSELTSGPLQRIRKSVRTIRRRAIAQGMPNLAARVAIGKPLSALRRPAALRHTLLQRKGLAWYIS